MDENDNAPVFLPFPRTTGVREDVPLGTVVLAVGATDADDGENGAISYEIIGPNGDYDGM